MLDWENVVRFYLACGNNATFQANLHLVNDYCEAPPPVKLKIVQRLVCVGGEERLAFKFTRNDDLLHLFQQNRLVAHRPGNVETSFTYKSLTSTYLNWHFDPAQPLDNYMKKHAGMYYVQPEEREKVHDWYVEHMRELLAACTPTLCLCVAHFDIPLLAHLNLTKTCYNYSTLWRMILENSKDKKIVYIGNACKSVQKAYDKGLNNIWTFPVSDFELACVQTPQTTEGVPNYPHGNMIETTHAILEKVKAVGHFDTAVLGCGAYGAPLINMMRRLWTGKNLCYLGSDCFKMFGILTPMMRWDLSGEEVEGLGNVQWSSDSYPYYCKENAVWVEEASADPVHPEGKYWKRAEAEQ